MWQVAGHIYSEEGAKVLALTGAWNSHLDMVKCDAQGDPLPDAPTTRLWQVRARSTPSCPYPALSVAWYGLPVVFCAVIVKSHVQGQSSL